MTLLKQVTPPTHAYTITPNDTVNLATPISSFMVGGEGNIRVLTVGDDTVTLPVQAGIQYVLFVKRIYTTDTTATNIIGFSL